MKIIKPKITFKNYKILRSDVTNQDGDIGHSWLFSPSWEQLTTIHE